MPAIPVRQKNGRTAWHDLQTGRFVSAPNGGAPAPPPLPGFHNLVA